MCCIDSLFLTTACCPVPQFFAIGAFALLGWALVTLFVTNFPTIAATLVAFGRSVILKSRLAGLILSVFVNFVNFCGNMFTVRKC